MAGKPGHLQQLGHAPVVLAWKRPQRARALAGGSACNQARVGAVRQRPPARGKKDTGAQRKRPSCRGRMTGRPNASEEAERGFGGTTFGGDTTRTWKRPMAGARPKWGKSKVFDPAERAQNPAFAQRAAGAAASTSERGAGSPHPAEKARTSSVCRFFLILSAA